VSPIPVPITIVDFSFDAQHIPQPMNVKPDTTANSGSPLECVNEKKRQEEKKQQDGYCFSGRHGRERFRFQEVSLLVGSKPSHKG
jgi:hypothetical protein